MSRAEPQPAEGLVVEGLARRFGRRWAVAGVDLRVPPGRALMITGANGSGKTTLLRCLATALPPHAGGARLDGQDLWARRALLRPRISLLSHASRLYEDLSAAENLRAWARLAGLPVDVEAALEQVGLPPDRPEPVRTFSAGMRRRVAIALAWLKKPDVLLFDEPFAALDPEGRALLSGLMQEARPRSIIVLATHLPAVAASLCDDALHLEAGEVVWQGPAAQAVEAVS